MPTTTAASDASRCVPPGFDENPTAWPKRLRLAALAGAGLTVALYLTLYQVGAVATVWDPAFGRASSRDVLDLTSPFPDAALGVAAYAAEAALSFFGGADRWRTLPWAALAFGAVIVAGAFASVGLIVVQAVVVGSWCALCLASAAISFALCALGIDEGRAAWQHVARVRSRGVALWPALLGRDGTRAGA